MRTSNAFKSILVLLLALLLVTGFTVASPANNTPTEKVLIGFKGKPDASLVKAHGGKIKYQYTIVDAIAATVPEKAVDALEKNPNVEYVEMDQKVHALGDTLDWGVDRIDAEVVWGGSDGATDVTTDNAGTGVKVAILDTGIDHTHPDLDDNYAGGTDIINDDDDPMDDNGHGTHCAGIVAAEDNELGVIGVAPNVSLYAIKVLDSDGYGDYSYVIAGLQWAVENDIDIVSMSLGSSGDPGQTVEDACYNAYDNGTLVVAAAGNEGNPGGGGDNVLYPARYDSVIAVAATDSNDNRASFSSTGPDVELAAPGVEINSTYWDTDEGSTYAKASGSSMACPHASGTAALVFAAGVSDSDGGGNVNDEVRSLLQTTAEDLGASGRDTEFGYGLVDAEAAVNAAGGGTTNSPPTADFTYTTTDLTADFTDQSTDSDGSIASWSWEFGDGATSTEQSPSHTYASDGTYTVNLTVTDDDGATDTTSQDVTVSSSSTELTVTGIDPNFMQADTTIDVNITGTGFESGAEVIFENGQGPAPIASNIVLVDGNITATVTAKNTPKERVWDVRVTNPDGSSDVLVDGFTVMP